MSRFTNRSFENVFLGFDVNKVSFHIALGFLENGRKQYFGVSNFTVLSVINSPGQSHSCCLKQSCLKDLLSQKLLIVDLVANLYFIALLGFHNLTNLISARRQSWFYFQSKKEF